MKLTMEYRKMVSSSSSQAPSPAPASTTSGLLVFFKLLVSKKPNGQLLRIELSVLTTIVFLFLLLFLGSIRQRVRFGWIPKYLTKIIYVLIPISITYSMGLMHNASTFHVLYPFWACTLVYAYGGVITMTACEFSDNDDNLQYFWRTLPLFFWTAWLVALLSKPPNDTSPRAFLLAVLFLYLLSAVRNTIETLAAFYMASNSKGLPLEAQQTVLYMREDKYAPKKEGPESADAGPFSMAKYRYLVWGRPMADKSDTDPLITTEEIWQSMGAIFPADCGRKERLKDMCLSYAFFRLILRRFAYFPLDESCPTKQYNRDFIEKGLLAMDHKRVFHIIEVELRFLFNFFYTKSHICTATYGIFTVCIRVFFVIELGFFAFYGLHQIVPPHKKVFSIQFHGHSLEVGVTRIVIFIFFLLELWKVLNVWFSNQNVVRLLSKACSHTATTDASGSGSISAWWIYLIWIVKDGFSRAYIFRFLFKPWQGKLGQYCFCESYDRVPILSHFSWFRHLVRIPKVGQAGDFSVDLSTEVKKAIVTSLRELLQKTPNGQPVKLYPGRDTIIRHSMSDKISGAFQLRTNCDIAHIILVWHIATSLCTLKDPKHPHQNKDPNFLVATQLSKYCAYLVAFAPELLPAPSHPFTTQHLFDVAVKEATHLNLKNFNVPVGNEYVVINTNGVEVVTEGSDEVVAKGIALAKRLMKEAMFSPNDPKEGWKFLAEFWTELLLYLAPSDNVAIHGEYLAKGGEFITHLWTLLTHAGVVTRSINCPPWEIDS